MQTNIEIIKQRLVVSGKVGLVRNEQDEVCGCLLEDLAPCRECAKKISTCVPVTKEGWDKAIESVR